MTITGMLRQSTVTDLDTAVPWFAALFGRDPDGNRVVVTGPLAGA